MSDEARLWKDKRYKHFGQMVDEVLRHHNKHKPEEEKALNWSELGRRAKISTAHVTNLRNNVAGRDKDGKKSPFKRIPLKTIDAIADALRVDPPLRQWFHAARNAETDDEYKAKQFQIEELLRRTGVLEPARGRARSSTALQKRVPQNKALVRKRATDELDADVVQHVAANGQPAALHIEGITLQHPDYLLVIKEISVQGYNINANAVLAGLISPKERE